MDGNTNEQPAMVYKESEISANEKMMKKNKKGRRKGVKRTN